MKAECGESKPVRFSQWVFQLLLRAYPKVHRQDYGQEMTQVFREQCRDAWRGAHWRGLVALWLRVLPDLVKTSVLEHIAAIKGRKLMSTKMIVFLAVSVPVFLFVLSTATIVTLILPESYSSKARIKMQPATVGLPGSTAQPSSAGAYDPYFIQTEFEVIQSEKILDPVVELLDLNAKWARKFHMEGKLRSDESLKILKSRIELRPVRNTSIIEITVYSDDKGEAAEIANAVAGVYRDYCQEKRTKLMLDLEDKANKAVQMGKVSQQGSAAASMPGVEIIDHATPGLKPVRPNVPLNITLGAVVGMFTALAIGGAVALLVGRFSRKSPATV